MGASHDPLVSMSAVYADLEAGRCESYAPLLHKAWGRYGMNRIRFVTPKNTIPTPPDDMEKLPMDLVKRLNNLEGFSYPHFNLGTHSLLLSKDLPIEELSYSTLACIVYLGSRIVRNENTIFKHSSATLKWSDIRNVLGVKREVFDRLKREAMEDYRLLFVDGYDNLRLNTHFLQPVEHCAFPSSKFYCLSRKIFRQTFERNYGSMLAVRTIGKLIRTFPLVNIRYNHYCPDPTSKEVTCREGYHMTDVAHSLGYKKKEAYLFNYEVRDVFGEYYPFRSKIHQRKTMLYIDPRLVYSGRYFNEAMLYGGFV